ncbi:MAG: hypothetical protein CM15mP23_06250 [Cryomorphaceae bacterium]|nr:MAG: hypothetical protein CM15mP23_06250 [Cryomorphaceae bacterium]
MLLFYFTILRGQRLFLFDGKWDQNIESIFLPSHISSGLYTLENAFDLWTIDRSISYSIINFIIYFKRGSLASFF